MSRYHQAAIPKGMKAELKAAPQETHLKGSQPSRGTDRAIRSNVPWMALKRRVPGLGPKKACGIRKGVSGNRGLHYHGAEHRAKGTHAEQDGAELTRDGTKRQSGLDGVVGRNAGGEEGRSYHDQHGQLHEEQEQVGDPRLEAEDAPDPPQDPTSSAPSLRLAGRSRTRTCMAFSTWLRTILSAVALSLASQAARISRCSCREFSETEIRIYRPTFRRSWSVRSHAHPSGRR